MNTLNPKIREVVIGAFFDEVTKPHPQTGKPVPIPVELMLASGRALGLTRNIPRAANFGTIEQPIMRRLIEATPAQVQRYARAQKALGIRSPVLGSSVAKGILLEPDPEQRSKGWTYFEPQAYLDGPCVKFGELATALECQELRIFTFNPPRGADSAEYVQRAIDRLGPIVEMFKTRFGLRCRAEIESNLTGDRSETLKAICRAVPGLGAVWDFGNVASQGDTLTPSFTELFEFFRHLHIKHYVGPAGTRGKLVEDHLSHYFPINYEAEATGVLAVFYYLTKHWETWINSLIADGATEAAFDLEPHVRGGGEFGGASGEDGLLIALIGLLEILNLFNIQSQIPNAQTLIAERAAKR